MRCDFCGEEVEGVPYQKDGMSFCSLECSDAMESGETIPISEEILDDPDELEDEEEFDILGDNDDEYDDEYEDDDDDDDDDDRAINKYDHDFFGDSDEV